MKKFESLEKYKLMKTEGKSQSYFGGYLPTLVPVSTNEATKLWHIDGTMTLVNDTYTDTWSQD